MEGIIILVKQTMRMLLRNKGFLFFIVILPIASVTVLNIKDNDNELAKPDENQVYLLEEMKDQICYKASNTMLPIKVYDRTGNGLGYEAAKELAKAGLFQIFYYNCSNESEEEIQNNIDEVCKNDHVGGIVCFEPELAAELIQGKIENGLVYYDSRQDDRTQLFADTLSKIMGRYLVLGKEVTDDASVLQAIKAYAATQLAMNQIQMDKNTETELSYQQQQMLVRIGYAIAILSVGYLYSGVFIADNVIKEKQYKVFNRIKLTDVTPAQYIISKYIISIVTVILQTVVIAIALPLVVRQNYGITLPNLLFLVLLLGIIFNTLSLAIGILCNDVLNTNYIAFVIWSISALLSGCYFDLSNAGEMMKRLAKLMPEKWALVSAEKMMVGNSSGYGIMLIVTLAFLMIIGVFGVIGTNKCTQE